MEYQVRQQADGMGRGENSATRASLAFCTLGGDSRSLDLIIRYDALCDRQYLRSSSLLDIRRHRDGKTVDRLKPTFESEITTEPDPSTEPDAPTESGWEPSTPEPSTNDPFAPEPEQNQTNEPNTH